MIDIRESGWWSLNIISCLQYHICDVPTYHTLNKRRKCKAFNFNKINFGVIWAEPKDEKEMGNKNEQNRGRKKERAQMEKNIHPF